MILDDIGMLDVFQQFHLSLDALSLAGWHATELDHIPGHLNTLDRVIGPPSVHMLKDIERCKAFAYTSLYAPDPSFASS